MASSSFDHADDARAALRAIVSDPAHGPGALSSPKIMANLLRDFLPDATRETGLLTAAAEKDLAGLLRQHCAQGLDASTAIRLAAASFAASTAFTPEACAWASAELAVALGLASEAQADSHDPPVSQTDIAQPFTSPPQESSATETAPSGPQEPGPTFPQHLGSGPAGDPPAQPPRPRRALVVIAGLALIAAAAGAGYGLIQLTGNTGASARGDRTPPAVGRTSPAVSLTSPAHTAASSTSPAPSSPPASPVDIWIAQLASVPYSAGTARLNTELARIRLAVPAAQVLDSSEYASLNPGFWVIYYAGPFADGTQALAYCAAHGDTTRNQCIGRFLSHSAADFGDQCYPPAASPSGTCYHAAALAREPGY